jgi:mannose-6-phosphate isomerase-like protein (cupin superfamily)
MLRLFHADKAEFYTDERCHITELVNDPGIPGVSLAEARVEPGVTTALHALDVREIYFVRSGRGRMEGGEGQSFEVGPGDIVDIPAGAPQRITNIGKGDLVFLCLCTPRFEPAGYSDLEGI